MEASTPGLEISSYIHQHAPVLFFSLDKKGIILSVNCFTARVLGEHMVGKNFQDAVLDFHQTFQLNHISHSDTAHLLTIDTQNGSSQTYHFHFYTSGNDILAFGHLDVDEIESLSTELLTVNQELNNLTRLLNTKNRELTKANKIITELTKIDPLTQLANRRHFNDRIEEMISLAERKLQPLSLIMTDIDTFKNVNDRFGHDAGDLVLQGYAELMKKNTRKEDLVARFGGEEFILLLPSTDINEAYQFSERIRTGLSQKDLLGNGHIVTASYGVSQLIKDEGSIPFIKRADVALYRAKKSGRNQTIIAEHLRQPW
jgi:diguanylate cyclase (GGDEF)-like protein